MEHITDTKPLIYIFAGLSIKPILHAYKIFLVLNCLKYFSFFSSS